MTSLGLENLHPNMKKYTCKKFDTYLVQKIDDFVEQILTLSILKFFLIENFALLCKLYLRQITVSITVL